MKILDLLENNYFNTEDNEVVAKGRELQDAGYSVKYNKQYRLGQKTTNAAFTIWDADGNKVYDIDKNEYYKIKIEYASNNRYTEAALIGYAFMVVNDIIEPMPQLNMKEIDKKLDQKRWDATRQPDYKRGIAHPSNFDSRTQDDIDFK